MNSICIIRYAKREGITFRAAHLISSVAAAINKKISHPFALKSIQKIVLRNIEFVREDDVNPCQGAMNKLVALNVSIQLILGVKLSIVNQVL